MNSADDRNSYPPHENAGYGSPYGAEGGNYAASNAMPPMSSNDWMVWQARQKDYTLYAIALLFAYVMISAVIAFIANYLLLREAERQQQIAGMALPGVPALRLTLWLGGFYMVFTVLLTCLFVFIWFSIAAGAAAS